MEPINNKEELLKDLQLIREAAIKNNNILKFISVSGGIKNVALYTGIVILVFGLALLWIDSRFGSYQQLPAGIRTLIQILMAVFAAILVWVKINALLRMARKLDKDMTVIKLMKEIYTKTMSIVTLPFIISTAALCVYFSISGMTQLIVPVLSIMVSLLLVSIMTFVYIREFLAAYIWLLLSGSISLFLADRVPMPLILVFTFGLCMFVIYITALRSISREKRDQVGGK